MKRPAGVASARNRDKTRKARNRFALRYEVHVSLLATARHLMEDCAAGMPEQGILGTTKDSRFLMGRFYNSREIEVVTESSGLLRV